MPAHAALPLTRWSLVSVAGVDSPEGRAALAWLCEHYWHPLRAHAGRRGFSDGEDQVQGFLANLIARGSLLQVDQERGRFRTWMLTSFDHYLANHIRQRDAQKRGAGQICEPLGEDHAIVSPDADPIHAFDRDWAFTLLAHSKAQLKAEQQGEGRERYGVLSQFLSVNGDSAAYAEAGDRLNMCVSAVKVAVHRLRKRLCELVRNEVSETLMVKDPAVIDAELALFIEVLQKHFVTDS